FWTSSTWNSWIECLWVEVGMQFARRWRVFFTRLENHHRLNPHSPSHIWLLQTLFLNEINQDCLDFWAEWNCHPICGPDTNDKSPKVNASFYIYVTLTNYLIVTQDLRFLGQIQFRVYHDDCEGVHPDMIEEHYGVHGPTMTRRQHQSGVGHPIDEEESDNEEEPLTMVQAINDQQ
ncbi:uncharacterized protein F5891DRAFT_959664, partial [Suillus fuscotomentosus]